MNIIIQTYMYTPASYSERVQLAKWTENVMADLFSLSLLNKRQIDFTTDCRTLFIVVLQTLLLSHLHRVCPSTRSVLIYQQ